VLPVVVDDYIYICVTCCGRRLYLWYLLRGRSCLCYMLW